MLRLSKPIFMLAVVTICVGAPFRVLATETSDLARNASEREPDAVTRGQTLENATHPVFGHKKKEAKSEESKATEQKSNEKSEKCDKQCKKDKKCDKQCKKSEKCSKQCEKGKNVATSDLKKKLTPEEAAALAAEEKRLAMEAAKAKAELEARLRIDIRHLSGAGWREAQAELINAGKAAIPILIESMTEPEEGQPSLSAYSVGGHIKADASRAPRQRHLAEVCAEMLTTIVNAHSNYQGEVPVADQKAWQEWWTINAERVMFAR
ncbi:MAG: hypothetical protein V1899_01850 [Planctomycetota bacterium]